MRPHLIALCAAVVGCSMFVGPIAAAPDQTQGAALMSATIANDGALIGGAGAKSSERENLGTYVVTFVRDIDINCAMVAIINSSASGFANLAGTPPGRKVTVQTRDSSGDVADRSFRLLVFCPQ